MAFLNSSGIRIGRKGQPVVKCERRARFKMTSGREIPDELKSILNRKVTEVANLRAVVEKEGSSSAIAQILSKKGEFERPRNFYTALGQRKGSLKVIAEIKRRSPSKGKIADINDPAALSRVYYDGGASAISVLTDGPGFGGSMVDLEKVVTAQSAFEGNFNPPCPVLRKDFIIDEIQIAEAVAGGASAVLLIVAALGRQRTKELLDAAHAMGVDALVEVHDENELNIALEVGAEIVGVNNRDLHSFEVSLDTSFKLAEKIPSSVVSVSESGIKETVDAWRLRDAGYSAILVGESLVRAYDGSSLSSSGYSFGYNEAKGLIRAFKAKGSAQFGPVSNAAYFGKGEAAKETLGELSI